MFPKMLGKGHYSKAFFPMFFIFVNTVLVTPIEERFNQSRTLLFRRAKIEYVEFIGGPSFPTMMSVYAPLIWYGLAYDCRVLVLICMNVRSKGRETVLAPWVLLLLLQPSSSRGPLLEAICCLLCQSTPASPVLRTLLQLFRGDSAWAMLALTSSRQKYFLFSQTPIRGLFLAKNSKKLLAINIFFCQ